MESYRHNLVFDSLQLETVAFGKTLQRPLLLEIYDLNNKCQTLSRTGGCDMLQDKKLVEAFLPFMYID